MTCLFAEADETSYCKHCGKRIWHLPYTRPLWAEDEMSIWNPYCAEDDAGESREHEPHPDHTQPYPCGESGETTHIAATPKWFRGLDAIWARGC